MACLLAYAVSRMATMRPQSLMQSSVKTLLTSLTASEGLDNDQHQKETIEAIKSSPQFLVSFDKYGTHTNAKTKISITYYTSQHAYTVEAWAIITRQKFMQLGGYDTLVPILKPSDYTATRTDKATGEDVTNDNQAACAAVFGVLCSALAQSTDKVHLDQYQTIKNRSRF